MSRLVVLAEIGAPVAAERRPWGLRRLDLEALGAVREEVGGRRAVVVTGEADGAPAALAVGLAAVAAAAGTRTVLAECDLERPRLAAALGLEPVPGLHEYLRSEASPAAVLQTLVPAGDAAGAEVAPLACIPAGRPNGSPRALLGLDGFRRMAASLREAYELTILLGPPLEGAGGALDLVATVTDCSIAALGKRPDRRTARATQDALSWLGAPALGAVVVTPS